MFFGEFLVIHKVINEDQLLDALTYQVENLPSFIRVLRDEKIISSEDLFRMIKIQLETNSDLVEVLRDEKKLDELQLHNLFLKQASNRKMLGEVLVELNITDQATVESKLYEFLRNKDNLNQIKIDEEKAILKSTSKEVEISDAALESMRELGLDTGGMSSNDKALNTTESISENTQPAEENIFVDEYLGVFNNKMKNKLAKLVEILKKSAQDDSDIANYFNSLYRDLHVLRGAAQAGELAITENFLGEWEAVIERNVTKNSEVIRKWCGNGLPALEQGLAHLWQLREIIAKDKSETKFNSMKELMLNHSAYLSIIKTL